MTTVSRICLACSSIASQELTRINYADPHSCEYLAGEPLRWMQGDECGEGEGAGDGIGLEMRWGDTKRQGQSYGLRSRVHMDYGYRLPASRTDWQSDAKNFAGCSPVK